MPLLFELARPLDDLKGLILRDFAGKKVTMKMIFDSHHVGRPYLEKNYKEALILLESEGKLIADPPAAKRRKGTFADGVLVSIPSLRPAQ